MARQKDTLDPALAFSSPSTCSGAREKHKLLAIPLVKAIKLVFKMLKTPIKFLFIKLYLSK